MAAGPSPWTALLESLHSALIDELVERHPEPKPELGLPLRQNRFAVPSVGIERLLLAEAGFDASQGIALLATEPGFMRKLALTHQQLWQAMLARATGDFARRGIQPRFAAAREFRATEAFPPSTLRCARVIWIPLRIPSGECFFGIGV